MAIERNRLKIIEAIVNRTDFWKRSQKKDASLKILEAVDHAILNLFPAVNRLYKIVEGKLSKSDAQLILKKLSKKVSTKEYTLLVEKLNGAITKKELTQILNQLSKYALKSDLIKYSIQLTAGGVEHVKDLISHMEILSMNIDSKAKKSSLVVAADATDLSSVITLANELKTITDKMNKPLN